MTRTIVETIVGTLIAGVILIFVNEWLRKRGEIE